MDQAAMDMLFDAQGVERSRPALREIQALLSGNDEECEEAVGRLTMVLDKGAGYSRVVAAQALLSYLANPDHARYLTTERARVIASNVIEIAPPIRGALSDEGVRADCPPELAKRIDPHVRVQVDDTDIVLQKGLPEGWTGTEGVIMVDGVEAFRGGPYLGTPWGTVDFKSLVGDRLVGRHTIRAALRLRTPAGDEIVLTKDTSITIDREDDLMGD